MRYRREWATGFWTLTRREVGRFLTLWRQTVFPPILSALLYILIFGEALGSRIRLIDGWPYTEYILPGLAMMGVLTSAYANSSSSLFVAKHEQYINDVLIAPLSYWEVVLAYTLGAMVRGLIVGILILGVGMAVIHLPIHHPWTAMAFLVVVSALLSCAGMIMALWAESWDHVMLLLNFVITPLVFLGGVFYSIHMLPPFWRGVSMFNPIFYMINGLRYGVLGVADASPAWSLALSSALAAALFAWTVHLFRVGYKLKS
ncbi:MAG TPA: ABC transporter permease [Gemmatimonadota bacterium]|nr:ABC transporter permease [Gemmatimonadota bacterium]